MCLTLATFEKRKISADKRDRKISAKIVQILMKIDQNQVLFWYLCRGRSHTKKMLGQGERCKWVKKGLGWGGHDWRGYTHGHKKWACTLQYGESGKFTPKLEKQ